MAFELNKRHVKTLESFVSQVEALMEELSCDSDTEHLLDQNIEDTLYTARWIIEELVKDANGEGE